MPRVPETYKGALGGLLDTVNPIAAGSLVASNAASRGLNDSILRWLVQREPRLAGLLNYLPRVETKRLSSPAEAGVAFYANPSWARMEVPSPEVYPFTVAHELGHLFAPVPEARFPTLLRQMQSLQRPVGKTVRRLEDKHTRRSLFDVSPYGFGPYEDVGGEVLADVFGTRLGKLPRMNETIRGIARRDVQPVRQDLADEVFRTVIADKLDKWLINRGVPLY